MLSCKEVTYIVSESLDEKPPFRERLRVRLHLMMCKACLRMARQMQLLRAAASRYGSSRVDAVHLEQEKLSEEARARILQRLSAGGQV